MKVDRLVLGMYETNCYVLRKESLGLRQNDDAQDCLVIDPGLGAEQLLDFLSQNNLNPVVVVLTHGHIDHIEGVRSLRRDYPDVKLAIHALDADMLADSQANLAAMMGGDFSTAPAEILLEDNALLEQAGLELTVLHTPGHTPGGICLYSQAYGVVFTDDTLFADSVGRSDFPGGSHNTLTQSIKEKLFSLPDETIVYPGHGPQTTIAHEKEHNPFLR